MILDLTNLFNALSDPIRIRILNLLQKEEICVGDIVSTLKIPQPTVSRHLNYLKKSNLIEARKNGLWSFYKISKPKTKLQRKLLKYLASCFSDISELKKDDSKAKKIRASGGCCPK